VGFVGCRPTLLLSLHKQPARPSAPSAKENKPSGLLRNHPTTPTQHNKKLNSTQDNTTQHNNADADADADADGRNRNGMRTARHGATPHPPDRNPCHGRRQTNGGTTGNIPTAVTPSIFGEGAMSTVYSYANVFVICILNYE